MNNRFLNIFALLASISFIVAGCGDIEDLQTPNVNITSNSGTVSQKNLSLLAEDPQPLIFDPLTGAVDTSLTMTVKVGDKNNQLLTDAHTVYFATEWGLIDASCVTVDGTCTVTWQTSFGPGTVPADHLVTITAYTLGEEDFSDTNGNGVFDDDDLPFPASANLFTDREEPFVDADRDGVFNSGDTILDVINGTLLGTNTAHDNGDGFLNSPSCRHSSLCSATTPIIYIWDDIELDMDGPPPAVP